MKIPAATSNPGIAAATNPALVSTRDGRSTNGRRRTSVYKATFADGASAVLQVEVETDSYAPQSHVSVRVLEGDTWSRERLVWLQGKQCSSHCVSADLTAGRLAETMRAMREEGHERPYDVLLDRAVVEDEGAALMDALDVLSAVHGALA